MLPTQDSYGNIPGYGIFWVLFLAALGIFLYRGAQLFRYLRLGRKVERFDQPWQRLQRMLGHVLLQRCALRRLSSKDLSGFGHAILFWGFCLFLGNYILYLFIGGGLGMARVIENWPFTYYFNYILDFAGIGILAALIWAAARRYIVTPARLEANVEAAVILAMIFILMVTHFFLEGLRLNAEQGASFSTTPMREAMASFFTGLGMGPALQRVLYRAGWWFHYLMILGFMVYLLHSKHLHILASPFNLLFHPVRRVGSFSADDPDSPEAMPDRDIGLLNWKQLLDLYSCTECGRCQVHCPATEAGTPLRPKDMVLNLKRYLLQEGDRLLQAPAAAGGPHPPNIVGPVVAEEELWACTTCGRCQEECPVIVEHIDRITSLRRAVTERGSVPASIARCLESLHLLGNPWEHPPGERTNWLSNLPAPPARKEQEVEVLYWVGCSGAYDPKGQEISRALLEILKAAGVTYAVIGAGEKCCGEPARRLGEEGLFQKLAGENISTLKQLQFARIVTQCPHCYNTLRHEYREVGGEFEVIHHTTFLADLIAKGRVATRGLERRVTFQDPCYLGRYNAIYEDARTILRAVPNLQFVEMSGARDQAGCCGGGGGQMWMEGLSGQRINYLRFAKVEETGAQILATACPFCKIMLDDACHYRELTGEVRVQDIAELVQSSLVTPR